jgi:hypothetical protein
MGRRYGKSRLLIWELILRALSFPGEIDPVSPETVIGALPTLVQAKKILWQPLVSLAETSLAPVVKKINRSDFRIDFHGNKPSIVIAGANDSNGDRLRGLRIYFAGCDEYQDWKPGILETVLMPAMADTAGSRALLTGTPKGRLNHLFSLFEMVKQNPAEYAAFNHPTLTNPLISRVEVEAAKKRLPPRIFRQEYEASFEDFPGKIYTSLDNENQYHEILEKDWLTTAILGIDWGDVNPALVVLGQLGNSWVYLEGWHSDTGQPVPQTVLDAELVRLSTKWEVSGSFADPSRPSSILGVRTLGKQYNLPGLRNCVAGFNRIWEGIAQVHSLIVQNRLLFLTDEPEVRRPGLVTGNDAYLLAEAYHKTTNKEGQVIEDVAPGQDDHILDALRYALSVKTG